MNGCPSHLPGPVFAGHVGSRQEIPGENGVVRHDLPQPKREREKEKEKEERDGEDPNKQPFGSRSRGRVRHLVRVGDVIHDVLRVKNYWGGVCGRPWCGGRLGPDTVWAYTLPIL